VYERHGSGIVEVWHPGSEFQQYERRLNEIARLKEEIEQERKKLKKRFPKSMASSVDHPNYDQSIDILFFFLRHPRNK